VAFHRPELKKRPPRLDLLFCVANRTSFSGAIRTKDWSESLQSGSRRGDSLHSGLGKRGDTLHPSLGPEDIFLPAIPRDSERLSPQEEKLSSHIGYWHSLCILVLASVSSF
jgi:hypothetical protein